MSPALVQKIALKEKELAICLIATFAGNQLKSPLSHSVASYIAGLVYTDGYIFTRNSRDAQFVRLSLRNTSQFLYMELDQREKKQKIWTQILKSPFPNAQLAPETATSPLAPRLRPRPMLRAAFAVIVQSVLILCFLIFVWTMDNNCAPPRLARTSPHHSVWVFPTLQRW